MEDSRDSRVPSVSPDTHFHIERDQMAIAEGWSVRHGQTAAKLRYFEDQGGVVRITILRDPIARALSRYWFLSLHTFTLYLVYGVKFLGASLRRSSQV